MKKRLATNIPIQHVTKFQRIVKDQNGIPIGYEVETPESVAKRTAELVAQDVREIIQEKDAEVKRKAETKFYRRGAREYYMISKNKVMRIVSGGYKSDVTIVTGDDMAYRMVASMITEDALEGTEITREDFAKEFEVASRLIVLEE